MRRRRWVQVELCLFCWTAVRTLYGQRLRVEFEGDRYLSGIACDGCASVLDSRKELEGSAFGLTLQVKKRDQVGKNRIRGDKTWSCEGAWS